MAQIAWKPIFLEAAFVVLGVVLALALNEWRESAARAAHAEEALASIQVEIAANRVSVAQSEAYHGRLMSTLHALRAQDAEPPPVSLFTEGFLRPARLVTTAWDTAQITGAFGEIDYGTLLALGQAYARQESYALQSAQVSPLLYRAIYEGGTGSIVENYANLVDIVGAFWYREQQLITAYDSTLAALGVPVEADTSAAAQYRRPLRPTPPGSREAP